MIKPFQPYLHKVLNKTFVTLIVLLATHYSYSQNMNPGFELLEMGDFKEAKTFFKDILKDYPDNKTAQLCLGRATGLSGNPDEATAIFEGLLEQYPQDFEIKLNYAESLLWNKKYIDAKSYYQGLLKENDQSFPAVLGYANTLSNLKEYPQAQDYINRALVIDPGNPNALTSKKYINLGYSNQLVQAQNFKPAVQLLKDNLIFLEYDTETLQVLANTYLIATQVDSALITYEKINRTKTDSIISFNGISLVQHLQGKEKTALRFSEKAMSTLNTTTPKNIEQQSVERNIQALIWNSKYKEAETLINSQIERFGTENWLLALRATLNIYKSNFKKSINDYNQILATESTSFDGNLGKSNAQKAIGNYKAAYTSANRTLEIYKDQKDALQFIKTLDQQFTPVTTVKPSYSFDNGDNEAYNLDVNLIVPVSTKLSLLGNYNYRDTFNDQLSSQAMTQLFQIGAAYEFLPNIKLKGIAGINSINADNNNYEELTTDISLQIKYIKLQSIDIGFKRNVESFNTALLERQLVQSNFYVNYNLSTNFNLGWFTQYFYTSQNDGNSRNLLFTSLYYNFLKNHHLKLD
ncbi:tetratricopeptide repeat protein [Nonlabens arenilitoris]|uniref:tetratricopeptide repeat protein n=1 Tax=Nonlabens arenilitoris TaxID=1217969 RepID=UPI00268A18A8